MISTRRRRAREARTADAGGAPIIANQVMLLAGGLPMMARLLLQSPAASLWTSGFAMRWRQQDGLGGESHLYTVVIGRWSIALRGRCEP